MKTILIFLNSMNAPGGIERVVSNLLKGWVGRYRLILLVKDTPGASFYPVPDGVEWHSLDEPLILDMHNRRQRVFSMLRNALRTSRKLRAFLKKTPCDYIYVTAPIDALETYLAGREHMKKLVISEHASAFAPNAIYRAIKRFTYPKALCVSVPNVKDCDVYRSWGCPTFYIPHLFTFRAESRNPLDTKIALNVGRYTSDKRQADLIDIWRALGDTRGWKLWIVGAGEEEERLRHRIAEKGVQDSVTLIKATREIDRVYSQASLFLFTSKMEGFGMVLLEAMAFGIPCLSYDCPSGPADLIRNGQNGYLIPDGDKDAFAERLRKLIAADDLSPLGAGAFETVKRWDNAEILRKWDEIFRLNG